MDDDGTIYLAKATESLQTAESEFVNVRYNSCANRCHYSCFLAAIAALLREGIRAEGDHWGHDYVQAQFNGQLINCRKHSNADLRGVLDTKRELREKADYRTNLVNQTQAPRALNRNCAFVQAVQREVSPDEC